MAKKVETDCEILAATSTHRRELLAMMRSGDRLTRIIRTAAGFYVAAQRHPHRRRKNRRWAAVQGCRTVTPIFGPYATRAEAERVAVTKTRQTPPVRTLTAA